MKYDSMKFFIVQIPQKNHVNLTTIPHEYMLPIIDFLYDNSPATIKSQKYTDTFLFNMIAVCDQFFVEELKKVYEEIVSEKISMKNVGELLEFGFTYNCELLKGQCMQFVSLNLAKVLEQRLLDTLDANMLAEVNKFYRNFYNIDEFRVITPYSDAIDDEELERFVKDFRVDFGLTKESESNDTTPTQKGKAKSKLTKQMQAKRNYEKEGIMSIQSLSIEQPESERKPDTKMAALKDEAKSISTKLKLESVHWTTVKEKKEVVKKKPTGVLAGLRANEILQAESKVNDKFTKLSIGDKVTPEKTPEVPIVVPSSPAAPAWGQIAKPLEPAEPEVERMVVCLGDFAWTPQKGSKQRKRLSSETLKSPVTPEPAKTNGNPWNTNNNTLASLIRPPSEIGRSETIIIPQKAKSQPLKTPPSVSNSFSKSFNNTFGSPKPGASMSFSEILEDEMREKQYVEKVKSKSLVLTQMEETAIEELRLFYNVDEVFDENIKIERKRGHKGLVNYAIWQIN
jgi:inhibitor of Bruton tyrosine kinase